MRTRSLIALTCALLSAALVAADAPRFSQSLTAEQRTATGIERLDSDQLAALDALMRLHRNQTAAAVLKAEREKPAAEDKTATESATPAPQPAQPVAFTQSLSVDQRRAAGLDQLNAQELSAIDALATARSPEAPSYRPALATNAEPVEFFPNRFEVHGEFGFSFGGGSGGYSSRAAWLNTTLLDTKTGTEIGVTIATGREKWKTPYGYRSDWNSYDLGLGIPVLAGP